MTEEIRARLETAFAPRELEIVDESEQHRGHAGFQEGGESHFQIHLRAAPLADMSRIARHRAVHRALGPDLVSRVHAIALDLDG